MNDRKFTIGPQPGCTVELGKLMETGKLLLEMGYTVKRIKVARPGQKTLLNALEVQEQTEDAGANLVCDAQKARKQE